MLTYADEALAALEADRRRQQQLGQDAARVNASLAALQKLYDDQSRNFHAERLQMREALAKVLKLLALLVQTYKY